MSVISVFPQPSSPQTFMSQDPIYSVKNYWNPHTLWQKYKMVQSLWKTVWWFLKKLNIELSNDPAIQFLGICWRELKTCVKHGFPLWWCQFPAPPTVLRGSFSSTSLPAFVISRLFDAGHSDRHEVLSHGGFDLHFPVISDAEHIFMCWPFVYLLWKNVYLCFCPFLNGIIFEGGVEFEKFFLNFGS